MSDPPLLQMEGISKSFPGVQALREVSLDLHSGEVLALLGENGAGKSTLIKVLAGAHQPDAGCIRLAGRQTAIRSPVDARRAGIAVMYQELELVPTLSATENIFLGREDAPGGWVRRRDESRRAVELFGRLGVEVPLHRPCRDLSIAQQQTVEIARALATEARILIMDEPSATLTPAEVDRLFAVIRDLKSHGLGIIYISHRLDEIDAIADRVLVLRDGQHVGTLRVGGVSRDRLIEMVVGRRLDQEFPKRRAIIGEPRLVVKGLCAGKLVQNVSLTIHRGEVLGLTGLVGSGRTETARALFGADRAEAGSISLDGRRLTIDNPRQAIKAGIALLTEDRKEQGLVLAHSARENFALPNLAAWSRLGFIHSGQESAAFAEQAARLHIRLAGPEQPAGTLSGGNQQKIVLAKWLQRDCAVILFDEPTRGIDVGGKYEIYQLINELAAQGKAILLISSELPEVLGMSDRILVMHEGRLTGEIADVARATQEQILKLAVG
jgi:ABC-type sugar transport system ATPase subunit